MLIALPTGSVSPRKWNRSNWTPRFHQDVTTSTLRCVAPAYEEWAPRRHSKEESKTILSHALLERQFESYLEASSRRKLEERASQCRQQDREAFYSRDERSAWSRVRKIACALRAWRKSPVRRCIDSQKEEATRAQGLWTQLASRRYAVARQNREVEIDEVSLWTFGMAFAPSWGMERSLARECSLRSGDDWIPPNHQPW